MYHYSLEVKWGMTLKVTEKPLKDIHVKNAIFYGVLQSVQSCYFQVYFLQSKFRDYTTHSHPGGLLQGSKKIEFQIALGQAALTFCLP